MPDRAFRDQNMISSLLGVSNADGLTPVSIYADPATHALLVSASVSITGTSATLYTGQQTVNTSQVQINGTSHSLSNGIIVKSLSTNAAIIYVGLTGVTTSTGDALEPGDARGYAVNNTNLLYIISASSTTDKITYSAN